VRTSLYTVTALVASLAFVGQPANAAPIVVAGSSLESPPPFWENSFWAMNSTIERAFQFTVVPGGPYRLETLQIAAYHYEGMAGSTAQFAIHLDEAGLPGAQITAFSFNDIGTTQQVLEAAAPEDVMLDSGVTYWIVGGTSQGQVNWNLGDNVFGTAAYRVNGDDWVVLAHTNVSAFALLGTPVPEPSCLLLMGALSLPLTRRRR
jgi:hypothetical protein